MILHHEEDSRMHSKDILERLVTRLVVLPGPVTDVDEHRGQDVRDLPFQVAC